MQNILQASMGMIHPPPQFVVPFLILVFLIFTTLRNRRRTALLKCLAEALNTKLSVGDNRQIRGEYKDFKYLIECIPESRNEKSRLEISIYKGAPFDLRVRKETVLHKIGKKINLLHEIEIYNELFDKEFYISSKSPDQASYYLNKSSIITAIKALFDKGFSSLALDAGGIFLKKKPLRMTQDLDPPNIITVLDHLTTLANEL